jgi:hypothetical protein
MQTEIYPDSGTVLTVFFTGSEDNIFNIGMLRLHKDLREFGLLERNINDL